MKLNTIWIRDTDRCKPQGLHQQLVGSEGYDPTSDEYYAEIDKRMRDSFPNKFQDKRQNAQAVVPSNVQWTVSKIRAKKDG